MIRRLTFILPVAFVLVGAIPRLLPHAPNVAPITALALFGGVYLSRRFAFALPLVALFLSDLFIGFYDLGTMGAVYGSFLVSGAIGLWVRARKSLPRVALGTLAASVQFFVLTNFAGWLFGHETLFPHTWPGLAGTYVSAIPFFRNTLLGDALYVTALFGLYELSVLVLERRRHAATIQER